MVAAEALKYCPEYSADGGPSIFPRRRGETHSFFDLVLKSLNDGFWVNQRLR